MKRKGAFERMSFTSKEFWRRHAPDFNFELNEKQLIEKALERRFIFHCGFRRPGGMLFKYNPHYKSVTAEDVNEVIRDNGTDASEMVQDLVDEELYGQ